MLTQRCPACGGALTAQERVVEERVPSTVPAYFDRARESLYRRTFRYEVVTCAKKHRFKRTESSLYGMQVQEPTR